MRLLYFSEALVPPFDEGIKKASFNLLSALKTEHDVLALTNRGPGVIEAGVRRVKANRVLLSLALRSEVRRFGPERVFYLPTACATLLSFFRARMLSLYAGVPAEMIALQPRRYGTLSRLLIPVLKSGPVWAQGSLTAETLTRLGCEVRRIPPAVDADLFAPVSREQKARLREKYGVAQDAFVALHVGHITDSRNVPSMLALQGRDRVQLLLVGSTAFGADPTLLQSIRDAGVTVIDRYLDSVQEVYQLADCYLFPVQSPTGSIEAPLSVLEAMACNLPVVATRFGELPALFAPEDGLYFYDDEVELLRAMDEVRNLHSVSTRARVTPYTWKSVAQKLMAASGEMP